MNIAKDTIVYEGKFKIDGNLETYSFQVTITKIGQTENIEVNYIEFCHLYNFKSLKNSIALELASSDLAFEDIGLLTLSFKDEAL